MTANKEKIVVFIPMYNCAPQIGHVLNQFRDPRTAFVSSILCVDNGSRDGTVEAAIAAAQSLPERDVTVVRNRINLGLGGSHKVAFDHAVANGFDYLVVLHGDNQGNILDIAPLFERGEHRGTEALMGARFMRGSRLEGYSRFRTFGNHVFNALFSLVTGRRLHDLGSGLNAFSRQAMARGTHWMCADDLTFNYHLILRMCAERWAFTFFPLTWREEDQISNVRMVRQTRQLVSLLGAFTLSRRRYLARSYAGQARDAYAFDVVWRQEGA